MTRRAFRTHWRDITSIVSAESPGKAKLAVMRAAREVGWESKWTEIVVRRAAELDGWAGRTERRYPVDEAYTKREGQHDTSGASHRR